MKALIYRYSGASFPFYATEDSVGLDVASVDDHVIYPGKMAIVSTGLVIKPPEGYWILATLRSSLAKMGLCILNGVGVIDPDYCGEGDEIRFAIQNLGDGWVEIAKGSRIGQLIFLPLVQPVLIPVSEPPGSASRGGFGSTGV